jgi:aerobic carbon-monoxide dehydrogenase medium subunit
VPGFDYVGPESVEEALEVLRRAGEDATVMAGGQSLMILLRQQLVRPALLVGLRGIAELGAIEVVSGRLTLGAMVTYAEVSRYLAGRDGSHLLGRAADSVGSVHIRNRGTVGGSVAHADPAGDAPTVLLALGADLIVAAPGASPLRCRIEDFFTGFFQTRLQAGELLVGIEVDAQPEAASYGYRRYSFRAGEYPMCVAAVRLEWSGGRCSGATVALGGADDRPRRFPEAEALLIGADRGDRDVAALLNGARDMVQPLPDVRGSSGWKSRVVAQTLVAAAQDAVAAGDLGAGRRIG